MDYLLPTALECPTGRPARPSPRRPHHPLGAKGVGESATVGSPPAVVNAVVDALAPFGVRHADMPLHAVARVGRDAGVDAMMKPDRTQQASQLIAQREPFVYATVVRAAPPTSVRAGDAALVRRDGAIDGFVGGVCAEASVRRYAEQTLATGKALLLRLEPSAGEERVEDDRDGHGRRRTTPA